MQANDTQVGGNHYRGKARCPHCGNDIQHWDVAWAYGFDFFQYIITKWVFRWREKGGLQDLKKAKHAITKYIEVMERDKGEEASQYYVDQD